MNKKTYSKFIIIGCCISVILTACTNGQKITQRGNQNLIGQNKKNQDIELRRNLNSARGNMLEYDYGTTNPSNMTRITPPGVMIQNNVERDAFDMRRTNNLISQMGMVDGVRNINVIVKGDKALVGYRSTRKGDNTNTSRKIVKRIKQLDVTIKNVIISDSDDVRNHIETLINDLKINKRYEELNIRFNNIVNNIKLQMKK